MTDEEKKVIDERYKLVQRFDEYIEWLENFDFKSFFQPESEEEVA